MSMSGKDGVIDFPMPGGVCRDLLDENFGAHRQGGPR